MGAPGDKQRNHSVKKSKTDPLRADFLEAIKLDRYNANRAPLFNAFVARFRLDMYSFLKTDDEKRKGRGNGEDGGSNDSRKVVETDKQKRQIVGSINKISAVQSFTMLRAVSTTFLFAYFFS